IKSPLDPGGKQFVARNGHSAVVVVALTGAYAQPVREKILAAAGAHPGVTIEETGEITASDARDKSVNNDLKRAEILSVPVTLFVLLFAFGAAVAAAVPVLLALTAVAAAFGLLGPISQAIPIDTSVRTVLVLIGMAVGVGHRAPRRARAPRPEDRPRADSVSPAPAHGPDGLALLVGRDRSRSATTGRVLRPRDCPARRARDSGALAEGLQAERQRALA